MKKFQFILSVILLSIALYGCGFEPGGDIVTKAATPDSTPPTISIEIANPAVVNTYGSGTIIIQGSAGDDLRVTKVETCVNNGAYSEAKQGFSTSATKLDWISSVDTSVLADGIHTITAKATDLWDNTSTASVVINVDKGTPLAMLWGAPSVMTDKTELNVSVYGNGITHYKYNLDDSGWVGGFDGIDASIALTVGGLSVGKHTLLVIGKKLGVWQDATTEVTRCEWSVNAKLFFSPSDGAEGFGRSVAVSAEGSTIVIGAPYNANHSGNVYVHQWTGSDWNETKLTADDSADYDDFGSSVAISSDGSTIAVGADVGGGNGDYLGSVYVYRWIEGAWIQTKKLMADDGAKLDHFGYSVGISSDGSTIVVGAHTFGSADVYRWIEGAWIQTKKLTADGGASWQNFGKSVGISSDASTVVIGAPSDNNNGVHSGSVYVYRWIDGDWNQTKKLTADDGAEGDMFGQNVGITSDGSTIVVGASSDDDITGSAYVYSWTGSAWNETKLTADDGAAGDAFGFSVGISSDGSTIVSGAHCDKDNGDTSGSAYIYRRIDGAWNETKLIPDDNAAGDAFGWCLGLSSDGSTIVVGALNLNNTGNYGSVYLFYR
ncbi:MAG: hypothetical protein GY754_24055 [bacterium]|nr:hypothetical protein [bacterium]